MPTTTIMSKTNENLNKELDEVMKELKKPLTSQGSALLWRVLQKLKQEQIQEFYNIVNMSLDNYFINFQNGACEHIEEFNEFVHNMTKINLVKKIFRLRVFGEEQ